MFVRAQNMHMQMAATELGVNTVIKEE